MKAWYIRELISNSPEFAHGWVARGSTAMNRCYLCGAKISVQDRDSSTGLK